MKSSTTSRGGVESVSTIVDDAKTSGGIGYTDPDALLIAVEAKTVVDPAVIVLEDELEYTFKIVDADHPDGVLCTHSAFLDGKGDRGVVWSYRTLDHMYEITYKSGANTIKSLRGDSFESVPNYPVSFYTPGDVHKIANDYLPLIPETVKATLTESDGRYSCDMSVTELVERYRRGDIVELLLYRDANSDAICKLSFCDDGRFGTTVIFNGNYKYQGVIYSVIVNGFYDPDRGRTVWLVTSVPVDQTQSLFINFILDKGSGNWSCDTSYDVIHNAILAGYSVRGDANGKLVEYLPMGEPTGASGAGHNFVYFYSEGAGMTIYYWSIIPNNNVVAGTFPL